jgi:hypothetical protein
VVVVFGYAARVVVGVAVYCSSVSVGLLAGAVSGFAITRGRALHAMGKIAKRIDPNSEMDLPDKPPGMHWSRYNRLTERFDHQSNVWNLAMMNRLALLMPRLQRRSAR